MTGAAFASALLAYREKNISFGTLHYVFYFDTFSIENENIFFSVGLEISYSVFRYIYIYMLYMT